MHRSFLDAKTEFNLDGATHSNCEHVLIEKKSPKETDECFLLRRPGRMLFHKKIKNFWSPF